MSESIAVTLAESAGNRLRRGAALSSLSFENFKTMSLDVGSVCLTCLNYPEDAVTGLPLLSVTALVALLRATTILNDDTPAAPRLIGLLIESIRQSLETQGYTPDSVRVFLNTLFAEDPENVRIDTSLLQRPAAPPAAIDLAHSGELLQELQRVRDARAAVMAATEEQARVRQRTLAQGVHVVRELFAGLRDAGIRVKSSNFTGRLPDIVFTPGNFTHSGLCRFGAISLIVVVGEVGSRPTWQCTVRATDGWAGVVATTCETPQKLISWLVDTLATYEQPGSRPNAVQDSLRTRVVDLS